MRYCAAPFRTALRALAVLAVAAPALAETEVPPSGPIAGPPAIGATRQAAEARLFADLKNARTEDEGRAAEAAIWRHWMDAAPDPETRRLLDRAMQRRSDYDFAGARSLLDEAIAAAPHYAEAWNQRGFVRFLQDDFDGALADVDQAIQLEPRHFAAMSGRAIILMRQGRFGLAQDQLRAAVAIHPFLKERSMIVPVAPTEPAGVDL